MRERERERERERQRDRDRDTEREKEREREGDWMGFVGVLEGCERVCKNSSHYLFISVLLLLQQIVEYLIALTYAIFTVDLLYLLH